SNRMLAANWEQYTSASQGNLRLQFLSTTLRERSSILPKDPKDFRVALNNSPFPGVAFQKDLLIVAWVSPEAALRIHAFDPQGPRPMTATQVKNPGSSPQNPIVAGFTNHFVVVWIDNNSNPPRQMWAQAFTPQGQPKAQRFLLSPQGAQTPILETTSFGAVVAWVQTRAEQRGLSIARIDKNGKLLAQPSWRTLSNLQPYLAMAWTSIGEGSGRGAIGWIQRNQDLNIDQIFVAPLGCD
ncbi:MAG: hypothetical protein AAGJ35_07820, partial [Myxococcota bacterium]